MSGKTKAQLETEIEELKGKLRFVTEVELGENEGVTVSKCVTCGQLIVAVDDGSGFHHVGDWDDAGHPAYFIAGSRTVTIDANPYFGQEAKRLDDLLKTNMERHQQQVSDFGKKIEIIQQQNQLDLINYSEWLDGSGLMQPPQEDDNRTHSDLIEAWRGHWHTSRRRD